MTFETHNIPQGKIMIAYSDKNLSVGILEINPGQELDKHNRPVLESLYQIEGKCVIKVFGDDEETEEIVLQVGDELDIPPGKFHMHTNPFQEKSITFWKASGDITEILDNIRKNSKM